RSRSPPTGPRTSRPSTTRPSLRCAAAGASRTRARQARASSRGATAAAPGVWQDRSRSPVGGGPRHVGAPVAVTETTEDAAGQPVDDELRALARAHGVATE